ncbi:MAG TPA: hypothetical protein VGS78_13755 [Candidatus Sulfotelmatobacter sp.]|nr:hypothetical protein [Candidatus Sulfotelmatobacter sp.]
MSGFNSAKISFLIVAVCTFVFTAGLTSAQQVQLPPTIAQSQGMHSIPVVSDDQLQRRLAVTANQERQIEIRRDTEKMAELTEQLKAYLDKAGQGIVSLDALKKAEQIEKLAKSVRSKMKQSL